MKKMMIACLMVLLMAGCQESEQSSPYTGNEVTYSLMQASTYKVSGSVTIKERKDGATTFQVTLSGTERGARHPVHLHLGDLSTPDADVAALLSPVDGAHGISETILSQLADETRVSYRDLIRLKASVKVHLSDLGAERTVVLAAGNIGASVAAATPENSKISVCQSGN